MVNQLLSEIPTHTQVKCYDTKDASNEAIVINPNYSHNLDYCKFIDIFRPPSNVSLCHIFSVLTVLK